MPSEEPLDDRCGAKCRDGGYCTQYPVNGSERCRMHGGTSKRGIDHPNFDTGAFSKHFTSHLTEVEQEAYEEAREALGDPESAQEIAQSAAATCLLKFRRTGDERFLRRFEGLCDKFSIAPDEELTVHHEGLEDAFMSNLREYHEDQ